MNKTISFIFLILLVVGCVHKRDLSENTAIVHLQANPNGLHITNDISTYRAFIFEYTQKTLVRTDIRTLKMTPIIAVGLPEVDSTGTRFTYTLRNDVKWDDGSALSVDDVIFSAKMTIAPLTNNPQAKGNYLGVIKNVIADSVPGKIVLITHTKHRGNAEVFSEVYLMQKKFWDPENITDELSFDDCFNTEFKTSARLQKWFDAFNDPAKSKNTEWLGGLGPYKITEWVDDAYIKLEKKKNWWGDGDSALTLQNEPDQIIFKIIKDENSVYYALRNENIDAVNRIGLSKLIKLKNNENFNANYRAEFTDQFAYSYLGMNMKPDGVQHLPIFSDKNVRKALAHVVPMEDIIKVFYKGMATRQNSYVSPFKFEYDKTIPPIKFDLEKAKKILTDAGWKDSDGDNVRDKKVNGQKIKLSFKLNYMTDAYPSQEIAIMIKDEAYKAGMEIILNPLDFGMFYEKAFTHDFDALLGSWTQSATYEDPTQLFHTSQWANFGANFCGFGDAESDSLIVEVNQQLDDELYKEKVYRLQKKIADEQPYIFMFTPKARVAVHKRFDAKIYTEKPQFAVNAFRLVQQYSVQRTTPDL